MIGSRTMRPRERFGDSRKENTDRFNKTPYSPDRHARYRRSERYQKEGGLSPLRSPLRREDDRTDKPSPRRHDGYRRSYSDRRDRNRDRNRHGGIDDRVQKEDGRSDPLREVDTARQLKFGESNEASRHKRIDCPTDLASIKPRTKSWSDIMEEEEKKPSKESFSKPTHPAPKPRSRSWAEDLDDEEGRLSRVRDDIERMKKRLKEPGFKLEDKDIDLDEGSLIRKQKQLDFGKNTPGYQRYIHLYRKIDRTKELPRTPNKFRKCSRRSWDMQIRIWRKSLHIFDPPTDNQSSCEVFDDRSSSVTSKSCQSSPRDDHAPPPARDCDSGIVAGSSSSSPRTESTSMCSPGSSQNDDFEMDLMDLAIGSSHPANRFLNPDDEDDGLDLENW